MTSRAADLPVDSASSKSASPLLTAPIRFPSGSRERDQVFLDFLVAHPSWLSVPLGDTERRVMFATILTDPRNRFWGVWDGENLVGVLYLGEIVPSVGATVHFVFLDRKLVGKRRTLTRWLGQCFAEYDLQRLAMKIPVPVDPLLSYARAKLGFKFEGEETVKGHPALAKLGMENPHVWVARQGSRRERSHWQDGAWQDVYCLRLLRSEFDAREATT